jgi:hypothetical protein
MTRKPTSSSSTMGATSRCSSWTSAGYAPLAERVFPAGFNNLVQRHFGGFLDRIKDAGGDINEPAGDGFMAISRPTTRRPTPCGRWRSR